jgi:hypothetical protein
MTDQYRRAAHLAFPVRVKVLTAEDEPAGGGRVFNPPYVFDLVPVTGDDRAVTSIRLAACEEERPA